MVLKSRLILLPVLVILNCPFLSGQNPEKVLVGDIEISGNRVTHESIIQRELEFNQGDTLFTDHIPQLIEKAVKNLLNLPLFHFATIESHIRADQEIADFSIKLTERWYIWLWPVFELSDRNFNAWLEKGDMSRLSYGLFFQQENFRGRLEKLHIKIKLGDQQEASLIYEKPYINRRKTLGSGFQVLAGRQNETAYITKEDKLIYGRSDDFLLRTTDVSAFLRWRPDIHFSHTLQFRYNKLIASDSLLRLNPEFTKSGHNNQQFSELSYTLKADFRDQRAYPLNGWYAEAILTKRGFAKADDPDFASARLMLRGYLPIYNSIYLSGSFAGRLNTTVNLPYNLSQALGYRRDYVRGYEYYVVDGSNFWLIKTSMKYALVKPALKKLKWPASDRFNPVPYSVYAGVFADAAKVWPADGHEENKLPHANLMGFGAGIDFVTYYDKVFRIEFSVNGKGETGFFLHFMAAI